MSGVLGVLGLGCRLGLAGGTVWGTHQLGLWGDAKQGEKIYQELYSTFQFKEFHMGADEVKRKQCNGKQILTS